MTTTTIQSGRLKLYNAAEGRLSACPAMSRLRAALAAAGNLASDLQDVLADLNGRSALAEFLAEFGSAAEFRRETIALDVALEHFGSIVSALPPAAANRPKSR